MQIIKISEALKEVGKPISGISGTIKSVFKRRTGVGQFGDWSMQDLVIKDETGEIAATFSGMDDLSPRKGTRVTLSSTLVKGIMKGLAVIEDVWKDKNTGQEKRSIKLKMDKDCFIDFGTTPLQHPNTATDPQSDITEQGDVDEVEEALRRVEQAKKLKAERLEKEAKAKAAQVSEDRVPPVNGMSYGAVKRRIIQTANLYSYALKSAKWALSKHDLEIKDLTTSAATLFIAFREDKMTDAMPMNLIEENEVDPTPEYSEPPIDEAEQIAPTADIDQEPKTWREVKFNGKALGEMAFIEVDDIFNSFKPKIEPVTKNYSLQDLYLKNALMEWKKENS